MSERADTHQPVEIGDGLDQLNRVISARVAEIESDFLTVTDPSTDSRLRLFMLLKYAQDIRKGFILGFLSTEETAFMREQPLKFKSNLERQQEQLEKKWLQFFRRNFRADVPDFQKWVTDRLDWIYVHERMEDDEDDWLSSGVDAVINVVRKLFGGRK